MQSFWNRSSLPLKILQLRVLSREDKHKFGTYVFLVFEIADRKPQLVLGTLRNF